MIFCKRDLFARIRATMRTAHGVCVYVCCMYAWYFDLYSIYILLYVSFAKEPYKRDYILQKRPFIRLYMYAWYFDLYSIYILRSIYILYSIYILLYVSFAKEPYKRDYILQKRYILRSIYILYSIYIQITIQITICSRFICRFRSRTIFNLYSDSGHELYSICIQIHVTNHIQSIFRFRSRLNFDLHSDCDLYSYIIPIFIHISYIHTYFLYSYIFPVSCTRDISMTCSVREVCICRFRLSCMPEQWPVQFVKYLSADFTCHACRSSGLFSSWSMYL